MHLTPQDIDKLMLHQVGVLAQKRLARGLALNYPEAVGLIASQLLEFIRDGKNVAELMDLGRKLLGRRQVLPGVAEMVHEVQVEGTFHDGSKLVTVHDPIVAAHGDLALALHGSFLPVPPLRHFPEIADPMLPGEVLIASGEIEINHGREAIELSVVNTADRPIQVGSHYHFCETNPYLRFDRVRAYGRRLDIPAGTAVRFEPGDTRRVQLVEIAGERIVRGGNDLAPGPVTEAMRERVRDLAAQRAFADQPESGQSP